MLPGSASAARYLRAVSWCMRRTLLAVLGPHKQVFGAIEPKDPLFPHRPTFPLQEDSQSPISVSNTAERQLTESQNQRPFVLRHRLVVVAGTTVGQKPARSLATYFIVRVNGVAMLTVIGALTK
jgi:hypothetical protein